MKNFSSIGVENPVQVCGLSVYPFTNKSHLLKYISDKKTILIALGAEKLLSKDERFREIVNRNVGYCDGIGTVLALRKKGFSVPKIPGAYLWLDIINHLMGRKIYIIGSKEKVLQNTLDKLKTEYPKINIVNARNGYFTDKEYEELKKDVLDIKPDIIFVAMGSPRQEYIMDDLFEIHPALYMGLGGSFDLYTGLVKPVPEWWKKYFRWEGLYRQFYDLKNLKRWKRQFVVLGIVWKIILNKV